MNYTEGTTLNLEKLRVLKIIKACWIQQCFSNVCLLSMQKINTSKWWINSCLQFKYFSFANFYIKAKHFYIYNCPIDLKLCQIISAKIRFDLESDLWLYYSLYLISIAIGRTSKVCNWLSKWKYGPYSKYICSASFLWILSS